MPDYRLPADYGWRHEGGKHTLFLGNCPLVVIEAQGAGWLVRTALHARDIAQQRLLVRKVDAGKRWAARWVRDRQRLIARACNRPDLLANFEYLAADGIPGGRPDGDGEAGIQR